MIFSQFLSIVWIHLICGFSFVFTQAIDQSNSTDECISNLNFYILNWKLEAPDLKQICQQFLRSNLIKDDFNISQLMQSFYVPPEMPSVLKHPRSKRSVMESLNFHQLPKAIESLSFTRQPLFQSNWIRQCGRFKQLWSKVLDRRKELEYEFFYRQVCKKPNDSKLLHMWLAYKDKSSELKDILIHLLPKSIVALHHLHHQKLKLKNALSIKSTRSLNRKEHEVQKRQSNRNERQIYFDSWFGEGQGHDDFDESNTSESSEKQEEQEQQQHKNGNEENNDDDDDKMEENESLSDEESNRIKRKSPIKKKKRKKDKKKDKNNFDADSEDEAVEDDDDNQKKEKDGRDREDSDLDTDAFTEEDYSDENNNEANENNESDTSNETEVVQERILKELDLPIKIRNANRNFRF